MDAFKLIIRKAFIKDYYKDIIGKPNTKQNKEYYELLKSHQMLS